MTRKTAALEAATRYLHKMQQAGGLDATILNALTIKDADDGMVRLSLPVEKKHANTVGTLHGGVSCTLVDIAGSLAISSMGDNYQKHVSIDINTTFLKPAPIGSTITVVSKADKVGKTLGFTTTTILNGTDVVCRGSHTKYLFFPKPDKSDK
ncbi:putative PaaI_thioesterase family protein [Hyaloraphidium curvatum]|nr:putative PaaI_thioesterase family protein [Hyaloraphidium curvatum]